MAVEEHVRETCCWYKFLSLHRKFSEPKDHHVAVVPSNGDIVALAAGGKSVGKASRVLKPWEGAFGAVPRGLQCWDGATPESDLGPNI